MENTGLDLLTAFWGFSLLVLLLSLGWVMFSGALSEPIVQPEIEPAPLPLKDPGLTNQEQGLYQKFHVERMDGSSIPGGKHDGCDYFVLDLVHDPYALEALAYYASACKETHPLLAKDLMDRARAAYTKLDDEGKL